jgi:hypothetical protein
VRAISSAIEAMLVAPRCNGPAAAGFIFESAG